MNSFSFSNKFISPNQRIHLRILAEKEIELWIKREDEIHPEVSGNKFRKLKYNILQAKKENQNTILSFGGAFSNHILATASAAKMEGLNSIGVIRGEELSEDLKATLSSNPTLSAAYSYGMKFVFISREDYRKKSEPEMISKLNLELGDFYLVPEGGTNELAVKGCEEILTKDDEQFDYICSCVGTGGTLAGLINTSSSNQKVLGYPALKGDFLKEEIEKFVSSKNNWELITDYNFGGYAKHPIELIQFINEFKKQTDIALDPIYTGKMMYGILDQVQNDKFSKGSKILVIHTGGLQGIKGINQQLEKKKKTYRVDI